MPDTKEGREKQAQNAERRQRERELSEARERADEAEPPKEDDEGARLCHRRGCNELPQFRVLERYQEETGHGAVEAEALLCRAHTREESPSNLDGAYPEYVFRVDPLPETQASDDE
jgi:hypothetical protein